MLLVQNNGRTLSHEVILSRIWGYDFDGDGSTVHTHIKTYGRSYRIISSKQYAGGLPIGGNFMKKNGIFIKIFAYTIVAMLLIVFVTATLFSGQFLTLYRAVEREQILVSYQPLVNRVKIVIIMIFPQQRKGFVTTTNHLSFAL